MTTYLLFVTMWFFFGFVQGMYYGPQYAMSSEAIPPERITLGSALINSGIAFGASIGMYISTITVFDLGHHWKWSFVIISIPVILLGIAVMIFTKEKASHLEEVSIKEDTIKKEEKVNILELFKNRNLILAFIIIFCSIYGFFIILTWLPKYLQEVRNVKDSAVATITSLVP